MALESVKRLLPPLTASMRKGDCGRLGIVGGSVEYTGAPYFAAISMLKLGADLAYVFCPPEAAQVIKTYSPDLIVSPSLEVAEAAIPRLHCLLLGPGLGRAPATWPAVQRILASCRQHQKPLVVDADGLWALTEHWGNYILPATTILTPNAIEFHRLSMKVTGIATIDESDIRSEHMTKAASQLAQRMKAAVFVKGDADLFATPDGQVRFYSTEGGLRRPGGVGDVLSGVTATMLQWSIRAKLPIEAAAEAAAVFTRECTKRAFAEKGRSMMASDVIKQISGLVKELDRHML